MLDKIIPSNARTQTIEYAVNELSKRENLTMNDVREYLDIFTQTKIDTGKKKQIQVTDPDSGEVLETREYPIMEPIAKYYSYRSDEREIFASAVAEHGKILEVHPELEGDVKISDALKELKKAAWNIKATSVLDFTKLILQFVQYTRTGVMPQNNIYLKSAVEGNGKSFLMHKVFDAAKANNISTGIGTWPTGEHADLLPFVQNLFTIIEDTSPKIRSTLNPDQLKAILRREQTKMNIKYAPETLVKAKAFVWACGNCAFPYSTRGVTTIETNSISVEEMQKSNESNHWLDDALDSDLYILYRVSNLSNFLTLISENFSKRDNNKNNISFSGFRLDREKIDQVATLLYLLQKYKSSAIDFNACCLNDLLTNEYQNRDERETKAYSLSKTIQYLFSKNIVRKITSGSDLYRKWDLHKLLDISPDSLYEEESTTAIEEVTATMKEWDKIIQLALDFENGNPEPPKEKFLKPTEDKLPDLDGWSFGEKYDTEFTEVNLGQQQVCVNKTKGKTANRTNEGVEGCNYLCECDDISKGEQMDYIEKLPQEVKDSIIWVCDSGGKSIHVVLKTASNCNGKEREYILKKLSDKYFGGHLDMSAKNASRLCRNPNAMRDNGMKQQCLYMNLNPKPLDISEWKFEIDKKMEEKEEERKLMNSIRFINSSNISKEYSCNTLDKLKDWYNRKPTDMKADCIAFLEGRLKDWNKGIACVRALRNYGFTDTDIELEGPVNDTWIKQSIKGAR